jgi:transposase
MCNCTLVYGNGYILKLTRFRGHRNICVQESTMAKTRPPYTPEFRRQMVELVRAGRSPQELARKFEPTAQSINNWVAQAERDAGRGDGGLTTAERDELHRLQRENRQLKLEREILSKAAAWFARETNTIPPKDSGS